MASGAPGTTTVQVHVTCQSHIGRWRIDNDRTALTAVVVGATCATICIDRTEGNLSRRAWGADGQRSAGAAIAGGWCATIHTGCAKCDGSRGTDHVDIAGIGIAGRAGSVQSNSVKRAIRGAQRDVAAVAGDVRGQ